MAVVVEETALVVIENVAELAPAGTLMPLGTLADALLSESVTVIPLVGAGPVNVTVPVEDAPPTTEVGFTVTVERAAAAMLSDAVRVALR